MESINMSPEETINNIVPADKYRVFLDLEDPTIHWRHGKPPSYQTVNQLFQDGRTKVWPKGSPEETVQNDVKSWEMELSHKTKLQDLNTINADKFKLFVNELFGGLLEGKKTASESKTQYNNDKHLADSAACPFSKLNN